MDPSTWEGAIGQQADTVRYDFGSHSVRGRQGETGKGEITVGLEIHLLSHSRTPLGLTHTPAHTPAHAYYTQLVAGQMMLRSLGSVALEGLAPCEDHQVRLSQHAWL